MDKIVIIGSPASGKSTLALKIGSILHINVVHLDRVFWGPGWKEKSREERIDILQNIVQEKLWIIEGTYLGASEPRLDASDTIIFLDTPVLLCLNRILKRYMGGGRSRRDIPKGCHDKLNLFRILKVLVFPLRGRRTLNKKLKCYESEKMIVRLYSTKQIEDFLTRLEAQGNEMNKPARRPSTPRNRQLALDVDYKMSL